MSSVTICKVALGVVRAAVGQVFGFLTLSAALSLAPGLSPAWAVDEPARGDSPPPPTSREPQRLAVSALQASNVDGRVLVRWETSFEAGVIGFNLFREKGGQWVQVNPGLVPAQDTMAGGRYHQLDADAEAPGAYRYRLAATLSTGRTIEVKTAQVEAKEPLAAEDLRPVLSEPRVTPSPAQPVEAVAPRRVGLAGSPVDLTTSSARVKIQTTAQGLHFLSTATLATLLGQSTATVQGWINSGAVTLSSQGLPVNFVPGNGPGGAAGLYFYAEGVHNNYTTTNVYWLLAGSNSFDSVDGGNPNPVSPGPYAATLDNETDADPGLNIVQDPEDDFWFWKALTANSVADTYAVPFSVEHLVRSTGTTATLKVRLYGGSLTQHRVEVGLNLWYNLLSGANNTVNAAAFRGNDLIIGGSFTRAVVNASRIARWDGTNWYTLGSGVGGSGTAVYALAVLGTDLYVGGTFTTAGGVPNRNRIAKWNGTAWSALGTGTDAAVNALAAIGTDIYAGGAFTTAGGTAGRNRIAKWSTTTSTWSALGTGLDGAVNALAVIGTDLYVGGSFANAGGSPASNVAKWSGTTWSALGSGLDGAVNAFVVVGTDLYVGGSFTTAGGSPAANIAKWNGTSWSTVGTGVDGVVRALGINGTDLFVGGDFLNAGGVSASRIAKWNGTTWSALDRGADAAVRALASKANELYVGGSFVYAGGLEMYCIAKWGNGISLGTRDFSGLAPYEAQFTLDATSASVLRDIGAVPSQGTNTLMVRALKPTASETSFRLDGYSLAYTRTYYARYGSQEAGANGNPTVSVPNLADSTVGTAPAILAFDVTNVRQLKRITNLRIDKLGEGTTWQGSFIPASPAMSFDLVQPDTSGSVTVLAAANLSVAYPVDLSDPTIRASYIVIAPASLMSSAQQLANYRSSEFRTKTILVDDVFNAYSYGLVTPFAIKSLIETAYAQWATPPRYVVLLGEGTWDYRNLRLSGDNLVPPRMVKSPYGLTASDTLFANVLGDGLVRVMVGRIPVKTIVQFDTIFAKMQAYEAPHVPGGLKALLVADQPDAAGDFITRIQEVQGFLAPVYTSELVHPPYAPGTIDGPGLRTKIQTALNGGVDVMNYIGHGALELLGKGGTLYYLKVTQPQTLDPLLANGARLPVLVAMTCVAGDFAYPGLTSIGESVVREPNAGAVAVVAPTGLSQDDEATWINRRVMELFEANSSGRIGDVFAQSASLYNTGVTRYTPVWIYGIIGDPALKIAVP